MPIAGPDAPLPSGVTLQPDVVVVHGGASVLKSLSSDHGTWTIDKSASGASDLAVGKVLLIAGVDCARVTTLKDNGDGTLDVTVEPVSIVDVVQDGSFSWDGSAIDPAVGVLGQLPYAVIVDEETADAGASDAGDGGCADAGGDGGVTCMLRRARGVHILGGGKNPGTSVSVSVGAWSGQFSGGVASDGSLNLSFQVNYSAGSSSNAGPDDPAQTLGGINAGVTVSAKIANTKAAHGAFLVSSSVIQSASMDTDLTGSADMSAQTSTAMAQQFPKGALVKLPLSIEYPLFWGPIPFYISYSVAFSLQPSLAARNAVLGVQSHIDFGGHGGFNFSAGSASPTAAPTVMTPASPLDTTTAPPSVGTDAVVFAIQAPRVGFGIGTQAFGFGSKAGVFIDFVNSLGLTVESSTGGLGCKSVSWTPVSHGGGEFNIKVGSAGVSGSHQVDLTNFMGASWYSPMSNACKP